MIRIQVIACNGEPLRQPLFAEFNEEGGNIGRGETSALVLVDPTQNISRIHANVSYREGKYFIRGLGRNIAIPVFLNDQPLDNDQDVLITSGDKIGIGDYVMQVAMVLSSVSNESTYKRRNSSIQVDFASDKQLLDDMLASPQGIQKNQSSLDEKIVDKKPKTIFDPFAVSNTPASSNRISTDFDPFADIYSELNKLPELDPVGSEFSVGLNSSWESEDKNPNINEVINPNNPLLNESNAYSSTMDPLIAMEEVPTSSRALARTSPSIEVDDLRDSLSSLPVKDNIKTIPSAETESVAARKLDEGSEELLHAFLAGAGVPDLAKSLELTPQFMHLIGQLLRESTQGTHDLLRARTITKQEMHVPLTMIESDQNNPLKFTPNVEMALTHLLTPKGRGFMTPLQAMKDTYDDLRSHQFGTMAGMRAALLGVLKRFNPDLLEQRLAKKTVIDSMLPVNRKARLWDLFTDRYITLSEEAQEDFHIVFGREFLQAYEALVAKLEKNDEKR